MNGCEEIRLELGAYALGALEPGEAAGVERHLAGCSRCRAELEELSAATTLLRTPEARALAAQGDQPPPPAEQALARLAAERRRQRRLLRGAASGGAAALIAVAALASSLVATPRDEFAPDGRPLALVAAPGLVAAADATLSARPWGTQVDLDARRLPPLDAGEVFEVWLVRGDGTRVAAGTFRPTAVGRAARVRLAAAVRLADVARVGVARAGAGGSRTVLEARIT